MSQAQAYRFKRRILVRRRYKKYIINGSTDAGKSTTGEWLAEKLLRMGVIVWDLWGAGTYENCFWCIPGKRDKDRRQDPTARKLGYPILVIHPKTTRLQINDPVCTCGRREEEHGKFATTPCLNTKVRTIRCKKFVPLIIGMPDNTPLGDIIRFVLSEKRKIKRVIVFNEGFYDDLDQAYRVLAKILKEYPYLIKRKVIPKDQPNCMLFRELGDLATGGMKTDKRPGQTEVKRQIQNLIRKNRHWHVHLIGDAQRNDDIAGTVADQKDFFLLKKITDDLIPERYEWIPNDIRRRAQMAESNLDFANYSSWPLLNQLQKWQCYVVHFDNFIELKKTGLPGFMHKGEHDDWEELANVEVLTDASGETPAGAALGNAMEASTSKRTKVLQMAYEIHEKEGKSYPSIANDKLHPAGVAAMWAEFGKPDSLQKAVKRAIQDGEITPV